MLRFIDLEGAYKAADKAVGGWLPGGGTANPLSDAVRPALEKINPRDPSVSNYYRENRDTAREQGAAAINEGNEIRRNLIQRADQAGSEEGDGDWNIDAANAVFTSEEGQAQLQQAYDLNTRARRHGVYEYGDLLRYASDREAVLYNRANAEAGLTADQIDTLTMRTRFDDDVDPDAERQEIVRRDKTANTRINQAERGANLTETISNSFGLDTRDGPENGSLGCVYGVNKVIEAAGLEVPWKDPANGANSVYIPFVVNWITNNGGSVVPKEEAQPGDIITDGGHMGILTDKVDEQGNKIVLSNSSSKGSMTYEYPLDKQKVYRVPQLQN